ncbi:MAG: orotidine-5'-phosphate decarboxylase [Candidatus Kapaibacterium sp.]|jgi:orotidine-5'-phosphate decarboxylase
MTFLEKLESARSRTNSILCVGLDTDWRKVPEFLHRAENPVLAFNHAIIDATKDYACAYKLNMAYYEAFGEAGIYAAHRTLSRIPSHIMTIGDVKRGDLDATSEQYSYAYQEYFGFDAITVNPLMGTDAVEPYLKFDDKGVFFLGLTSNPSAQDFEYLELKNGKRLYEEITDKVREWNVPKANCGLVVGATKPEELAALRARAPELPFLIPGIGAQGGSLKAVIEANGRGHALINVSRGITGVSREKDFAEAAGRSAEKFAREMQELSPMLTSSVTA